ncbi:HAD-IIB family hydrolase [Candidatus Kaiserbacteria bacterium]|nr:HAD-IIB family hydrolase [Candidatus Kaiserbacteria bacterium]
MIDSGEFSDSIESFRHPDFAYLFDVDGTLTEPEAKQVELPEIFDELARRLERRQPIGLNTGRSSEFIVEKILKPLEAHLTDATLLQRVFATGELGAVQITYGPQEERIEELDQTFRVPETIQSEVRALAEHSPYREVMFYDETKQTMASVELLPKEQLRGRTLDDFRAAQQTLIEDMRKILVAHDTEGKLNITSTRIATDIHHALAGKALGARKFLTFLEQKNIHPRRFLAFGDSQSDYEMYRGLRDAGARAHLVFVGDRELLREDLREEVIFSRERVDKGTLEFLVEQKL